jgi:two-component system sensor histidine kinase DesK
MIESARRVVTLILVECAFILAESAIFTVGVPHGPFHVGWPNAFFAIFLVVVIGGGNIYFAQQKRAECKLRAALEENVTLAAVAERERIARDLHDVLGHTLSVIVLKAELAGRLVTRDPERAVEEMADVETTARTALGEIREAIGGYRSRGLSAEIEAARRTLDAAGVMLLTESNPERESFTPQEETALALALREAVTNIVRHARATTCRLGFISQAGSRRLVVEDDGPHAIVREGNGLRGMRERIESIGGHFSLEQGVAQNHGTRLIIELPQREATAS